MGYNKNVRCASDYVSRFKKSIREGTGGRIQSRGKAKKKVRRREEDGMVVSLETDGGGAGRPGGLMQPSWWADEDDEEEDGWGVPEEEEGMEIVDAVTEETGVKGEHEVWTWGMAEGEV